MAGQAACLIFADGLDRPGSVSFTSYLRGGGGMFLDKDVRTFLGNWGIINFLFWGQGLHDFLIKIFSFIFWEKTLQA